MKKVLVFFLLVLILFQSGLALWFSWSGLAVNHVYMQHTLHKHKNNVNLAISVDDYNKLHVNHKELSYKGDMYELKSRIVKNNIVHLVLVPDRIENMIKKFGQILSNKEESKNQKGINHQQSILKLVLSTYLLPTNQIFFNKTEIRKSVFQTLQFQVSSFLSVLFKPPRLN